MFSLLNGAAPSSLAQHQQFVQFLFMLQDEQFLLPEPLVSSWNMFKVFPKKLRYLWFVQLLLMHMVSEKNLFKRKAHELLARS
jgi:hypothetical protein